MRSDGRADAVALDVDDLRQSRERQRKRIGRRFGRRPGMAHSGADLAVLIEDAGDHRVDSLADVVASADGLSLTIPELEQ